MPPELIDLTVAADTLRLRALVRVLPGRRLVYRGDWRGKAVFVKIFFGQSAARYAARDVRGALLLASAGLLTPALCWHGEAVFQQQAVHLIIYSAVPAAVNAADAYIHAGDAQSMSLLHALVLTLAAQHAAGLCQTDLHLKNFLLSGQQVWSIDGDGIRQQRLSVRQAYRQLAELLSKLSVLDQHAYAQRLLETYNTARNWTSDFTSGSLLETAKRLKSKEVEHYVHDKIFRNCSDVRWQQQGGEAQAISVAGGLQPTSIAALEAAMLEGQPLKQGNTCTVSLARLQDRQVVIKRYNIKSALHALSRAWRSSRAAASWRSAHRLQYYGFQTPQPLLMLENRCCGLRGKAYYVAEYSELPDVSQFFQQTSDKRLRAEAMKQLALFCYQLYLLRLSHGDMKASNLQVTAQGQLVIMDLDSMRQHRTAATAMRAHGKDLRRLLQNWKDDSSLYNALLKSLRVVYADPSPLQKAGISV